MSNRYTSGPGVYHITPKPGLPNVAILHGVYVLEEARGNGAGHSLMESIVGTLKAELYDQAICTTACDNWPMRACLSKAGWKLLTTFHNRKSGGWHHVYGLNLAGTTS